MKISSGYLLAFGLFLAGGSSVFAYDWNITNAHVVSVEGSYMPGSITFWLDQAAGTCPAGAMYSWQGGTNAGTPSAIDNNKAIYATLLAAMISGKSVSVYGNNAGCLATFIHANSF